MSRTEAPGLLSVWGSAERDAGRAATCTGAACFGFAVSASFGASIGGFDAAATCLIAGCGRGATPCAPPAVNRSSNESDGPGCAGAVAGAEISAASSDRAATISLADGNAVRAVVDASLTTTGASYPALP